MTSCPEALRILGIWKKTQLVEIQTWARPDDFVRYGRRALVEWVEVEIWAFTKKFDFRSSPKRDQKFAAGVPHVLGFRWKSQHRKKLCLCLLMLKNLKLKKVIKSFVPEPISSVFRIPWTLTKRLEKKLDGNYTTMLRAILNKSWRQHPTRRQLYGHLPPITKTI